MESAPQGQQHSRRAQHPQQSESDSQEHQRSCRRGEACAWSSHAVSSGSSPLPPSFTQHSRATQDRAATAGGFGGPDLPLRPSSAAGGPWSVMAGHTRGNPQACRLTTLSAQGQERELCFPSGESWRRDPMKFLFRSATDPEPTAASPPPGSTNLPPLTCPDGFMIPPLKPVRNSKSPGE
jgi:hypothetical protein